METPGSKKRHDNGVKINSCFNDLSYFNILNGLPPDLMHDLLEGVVRHNFASLMDFLTKDNIYDPKKLNHDLSIFKYGRLVGKNKVPTNLFTVQSTYKISATHMWTLARIFIIINGEKLKHTFCSFC